MTGDTPGALTFIDILRQRGGEAGKIIADRDWSVSPIGAIDRWPAALRTVLATLLYCPVPIVMLWGEDGVMLYNDAYSVFAGGRHPDLLGSKVREGWPEVADFNDNVMKVGLAGGTLAYKDQELTLYRHGVPEQVWMNLDYSPVLDENGHPAGVIAVVVETTERVLNARQIEETDARLQQALSMGGGIGTWDWDVDNDRVFADARFAQLYSVDPGHAREGAPINEFFKGMPPEDLEHLRENIDHALVTGEAFDAEYRLVQNDGGIVWVAARGRCVVRDDGARRFSGVSFDITYRKQAELRRDALVRLNDALREASDVATTSYEVGKILGEVLNVSRVGFGTVNPMDDSFVVERDWNAPGVQSLAGRLNLRDFGTFVEDLKQGRFIAINDTREDPRTASATEALEARHARAFVNLPVVENDRTVAVLYINNSEPRAWSPEDIALINDIGQRARISIERARAEQDLQRLADSLEEQVRQRTAERNLLATVFESTDAFIHVVDLDYRWLAINQAGADEFARVFGPYPKVGDRMLDLLADQPAQHDAAKSVWSKALGGEEFTAVAEFGEANRVRNSYEMKFNNLYDDDGRRIGAYQVVTNINDRVAAETKLAETQEALRQAQKMEAVGQLTGGIAHDFNNMLAVVIGSLDLLNRRTSIEDTRAKHYIDAATDAAKRSASLTQRLLAFSRQQPLKPESLDLNRLVSNMSDLLRHSIGADIRLETVLSGGLWRVHADPNQLENIILNMAVNSRDAMPGGGRLTIETHNAHLDSRYAVNEPGITPGHYVMLAITDTGTGMSADTIAKAFDPFFTTKEVGKGTGLGLSQVYGFVKQSGGHCRIYSEEGQGTTVKIYLPRDTAGVDVASLSDDTFGALPGEQRELVLIVDDEPAVRQFSADAFAELGYGVIEAGNAAMALEMIRERADIALLFADIVMPDINGRQLVDAALLIRPDLKVLYTTGYTRNAVVHNGVLDAGVELIGKPFTLDELAAKVRDLLDR